MLFKSSTVQTNAAGLKQLENKFLNGIMEKYLHRPCTDADARNMTLKYNDVFNQNVYDLMFGSLLLGTVRKSVIFGKQKMKFAPSQHYTHIASK